MSAVRDPRATSDQYRSLAEYLASEVEKAKPVLEYAVEENQPEFGTALQSMLATACSRLRAEYSLGTPMDALVPMVRALGELWSHAYEIVAPRLQDPAWERPLGSLSQDIGLAIAAVDSMSWAAVVREREAAERVLATPAVQRAHDPVIGHLARFAGIDAATDGELAQPKLWQGWLAVTTAPEERRQQEFLAFVQAWPKVRKKAKAIAPPGDDFYDGQFAFDAAPLAVCLDLDDSAVRDLPDYPADLVDYGRSLR